MDKITTALKCGYKCQQKIKFFDITFSLIFVIMAIIISIQHACKHLANYSNPFFQDKIIGIFNFSYII